MVILGLSWWSLKDNKSEVVVEDTPSSDIQSLTVNHYFQEENGTGKHTIEGTMTLPTPCHSLTNEVIVAKSMPEQVTIKFNTKAGEGICTQVLADKFFRVAFDASRDAVISATLNGKPLTLKFAENLEGITK